MNKGLLIRNIGLIVVFGAIGFTMFTENVRTVQMLGLFASGAVCGVSFAAILAAIRSRQTKA